MAVTSDCGTSLRVWAYCNETADYPICFCLGTTTICPEPVCYDPVHRYAYLNYRYAYLHYRCDSETTSCLSRYLKWGEVEPWLLCDNSRRLCPRGLVWDIFWSFLCCRLVSYWWCRISTSVCYRYPYLKVWASLNQYSIVVNYLPSQTNTSWSNKWILHTHGSLWLDGLCLMGRQTLRFGDIEWSSCINRKARAINTIGVARF